MENYDINKHIVSQCLPNINEDDSGKYICLSCHGRLQKTDYENPIVLFCSGGEFLSVSKCFQ